MLSNKFHFINHIACVCHQRCISGVRNCFARGRVAYVSQESFLLIKVTRTNAGCCIKTMAAEVKTILYTIAEHKFPGAEIPVVSR
jgi:hypothetical protein